MFSRKLLGLQLRTQNGRNPSCAAMAERVRDPTWCLWQSVGTTWRLQREDA